MPRNKPVPLVEVAASCPSVEARSPRYTMPPHTHQLMCLQAFPCLLLRQNLSLTLG